MTRQVLIDMRKFILVLTAALGTAVAVSTGTAHASGFRYCDRPSAAGQFLKASPSVKCSTARRVENAMFRAPCIERLSCTALGFRCVSVYGGDRSHPFSFSHHGDCRSARNGRIVFDGG
jgi:hypothetical protein